MLRTVVCICSAICSAVLAAYAPESVPPACIFSSTWPQAPADGCAVVHMNTNKVNVQNDQFFADLHGAFDRLEREFRDRPVVLTSQGRETCPRRELSRRRFDRDGMDTAPSEGSSSQRSWECECSRCTGSTVTPARS